MARRKRAVDSEGELDIVLSPELNARHEYVDELASSINHGSVEQVERLKIATRAELSKNKKAATFKVTVPKNADTDLTPWSLRLADFLFSARATLDNVYWLVTHDKPTAPPSRKEEKGAYFPIASDESAWKVFAGGSLARKIREPLLDRLRSVQPFQAPDAATSRGLVLLHKIHQDDKHRRPLSLSLRLDTKLPIMLSVGPAKPGPYEWTRDWLDWQEPVRDGLPIVRYRLNTAIKPPAPPPAFLVAPNIEWDGQLYDLQDFMWDIQGGVLRVIDQVCLGVSVRADLWDEAIAWRREAEAACSRSIIDGTNEWEERGFNRPSPYDAIYEELAKPDPDLSRFIQDPLIPVRNRSVS